MSAMQSSYLPATTESIALAQEAKDASESISILYRVLEDPSSSSDAVRVKELAITNLTNYLTKENRAEELRNLLTQLRPFFALIPKAKTAKIVRGIIDAVSKIPGTSDLQISLCKEMIEWTRAEKRTFLRQRVEARLASLLLETQEYTEALTLLSSLIKEVRRLDDKLLLVDIDLLESKLHFSLRNLPKAKASLTAARTAANAIYVPPAQQGTIDLQSGILHAEEKDYKTAYSYFFEAFEGFNALEDPKAIFCLKYMLLCKIMVNHADDVAGIISSKAGLKYVGPDVDAMKAVADAYSKRSLKYFETALRDYKAQLEEDPIVHRHLSSLYDTLLEQNLCRLIEPYSRVEIAHVAEMIELPIDHVEKKLSQMILDKKFSGTLDQGAGCLIIFEDSKTEAIFPATLETISNCDPSEPDSCDAGSNGGLMTSAFSYLLKSGGLEREKDYPYTGKDGTCKFDKSKIAASVQNFSVVSVDEEQIAANLLKHGPLAIGINAAYMQTYIGGVSCPYICGRSLDHGVLLVGYGASGFAPSRLKNKPYWIIKNSWGENWGEKGYYKICKGSNVRNKCGVDSMVSTVSAIHTSEE